ncbi:MAG: insulinase family protein [Deltaproteobacteria bacterium]|nr:insulinase family protein [Deltaproteobacteria bacterium]
MHSRLALAVSLVVGLSSMPADAAEPAAPARQENRAAVLDIPFTKFQLSNGLTVIFHEDHTQPLVATNLSVNVGSRDEPAKRTGFAHLFEHLMFMGTDRVPEKMFDAWMEQEGGSNNAWTSNDRTVYHDVAPSHALPLLLWMEADRVSTLGRQITLAKLDAQRDVVKNERRQTSENEPYGKAELVLPELLFPEGHPYHHPVIGSHEDLTAASVDDVRGFFARHYVPQNMSLVVAGDFDAAAVKPLVERFFGSIPRGPEPGARPTAPQPKHDADRRQTIDDNVSLPKLIVAWPSPAHLAPGDAELDLLSQVLSAGKGSRLYKTLVYEKKLAQSVEAAQMSMAVGSYFTIEVLLRPGVSFETIERTLEGELDQIRATPVSTEELTRARNAFESHFVERLQSVATRASLLNGYFAETGDPGFIAKDLRRYQDATPDALLGLAKTTLTSTGRVLIRIKPAGAPDPVDVPPEPKSEPQRGPKGGATKSVQAPAGRATTSGGAKR